MNAQSSGELDRYITGNYGEDQERGEFAQDRLVDAATVLCDLIQLWRLSGKAPDLGVLAGAHDKLKAALEAI